MKKAHWVQVILFLAFIGVFFVLHLCLPDKDFSQQENRVLEQAPKFSFKALFDGDFTADFESYTTDQFPARDMWTSLKARSELALGKEENNGVYLCPTTIGPLDNMLIERYEAPEDSKIEANVAAVNKLVENTGLPVYFALIPGAAEFYKSELPANAPMDSQREVIEKAYAASNAVNVDMYSALSVPAQNGEYVFYGTDHHWTSRGAYYGYTALAEMMGFPAREISSYDVEVVADDFYGTTYSTAGFSWIKPDRIERWVPQGENVTITNYPTGMPEEGSLYVDSFLSQKDKYSSFLGGNTPLVTIKTGLEDKPKLLIVRDSYMDSVLPFLQEEFSEIHVLDLRYNRMSLKGYAMQNGIDQILVCYSAANFSTDANLFLLGM